MKKTFATTLMLVILGLAICETALEGTRYTNQEGVSSTFNSETTEAKSYSLGHAKVDPYYAANQNNFKAPEYSNIVQAGGNYFAREAPSEPEIMSLAGDVFYDGSRKYKVETIVCNQYTSQPLACMANSSCGWCKDNNKCVQGNNLGPLSSCSTSGYVFNAPNPGWNPLSSSNVVAGKRNENGVEINMFTLKQ